MQNLITKQLYEKLVAAAERTKKHKAETLITLEVPVEVRLLEELGYVVPTETLERAEQARAEHKKRAAEQQILLRGKPIAQTHSVVTMVPFVGYVKALEDYGENFEDAPTPNPPLVEVIE
ncbi:MAG: hypothetical protein AAFX06_14965 [Planctomycetota bacterium]